MSPLVLYGTISNPILSILIVNWNGAAYLKECLDSIINTPWKTTYEIIVIDNLSHDNSLDILKEYTPHITLIPHNENAGFAKEIISRPNMHQGTIYCCLTTILSYKRIRHHGRVFESHPTVGHYPQSY